MAYITPTEYKTAPTAVDVNNLVAGGNQAAQDAELAELCRRATSIIDSELGFSLAATSRVEFHRTRYQRDGALSIHPNWAPLNQLTAVSIGTTAADLVAVSATALAAAFIEEQQWILPIAAMVTTGFPIQLGGGKPGARILAKTTAVSGYPNTTLTVAPAANATQLTVAAPAGFTPAAGSAVADEQVQIIDGALTETVTVVSVAGNVLTLAAPIVNAHAVGVVVSALPADVKEACTLGVSTLIRNRQNEALSGAGQTLQPGPSLGDMGARGPGWPTVFSMISGYKRVR